MAGSKGFHNLAGNREDIMSWSARQAKHALGRTLAGLGITRETAELARLRRKFWTAQPGTLVHYQDYSLRITDGPSFYVQCKDEFVHRIYHFEASGDDPLIIDGGSNVGMSILYFKRAYPTARVIGFEPDPNIFRLLRSNIRANGLENVTLVEAGLGAETGFTTFVPDNSASGQFKEGDNTIQVRVERLSNYLHQPVDFLKLNIEGQELPVLKESEASGNLRNVREMVLEYHGWANGEQRLGRILNLLDR